MKATKVNKNSKNTAARKNAEALKAKKKSLRDAKGNATISSNTKGKGKSIVPQSKKKK